MCRTKIALLLSGNALHSDLTPEALRRMWNERYALRAIGESEVSVSVSFQGIDYRLIHWLSQTVEQHPSIDVISAPYSHALIPLLHRKQQIWERDSRVYPEHPVMLFGEFYVPASEFIGSPATLILGSETVSYSFDGQVIEQSTDPMEHDTIRFGENKIGLVVKGFEGMLSKFYHFQQYPTQASLDELLDEIRWVIEKGQQPVVIWPIDIEAPWVGSFFGGKIWEMFFEGLRSSGLSEHFITLLEAYEILKDRAVDTPPPDRDLSTKWTKFTAQIGIISKLQNFQPRGNHEHALLAFASGSDSLSCLHRKIIHPKRHLRLSWQAMRPDGSEDTIIPQPNEELLALFKALRQALFKGRELFAVIREQCNLENPLVETVMNS